MIRYAVRHPLSTFTLVAALVAMGLFSLLGLPVSLLPRLDRPQVRIVVDAPLRSRQQLLESIVEPLEPRLLSIEGATSVRTLLRDGRAVLHLESDWFVDPDRLHIEVERRLADLGRDPEVEVAVDLRPADRSPVAEVAVTGPASPAARAAFVRDLLVPELASLQGAATVEAVGLAPRQVVVRPRAAQLAARGLTAADLVDRLEPVGTQYPVGKVRRGAVVSDLMVEQTIDSLDDLRRLPLDGLAGPRLGDVAEVAVESVADGSFARLDGHDAALVRVFRAPGANGIALVAQVRATVAELARRHDEIRLAVVHDRSSEIVQALELLALAAVIGLLAGALVLRYVLGSWRHALTLAVIVPGAIVASFIAFHLFDVSLNLISLSGLGLAVGLLVDSAIVVLESIEGARSAGEEEAAVAGTRRVAGAVVAAFLTTAVVFLPLVYLTGLARAFFGIQAFAIVSSLLFALLLSLTLTPVLSRSGGRVARRAAPGQAGYGRLVERVLDRPALTAGVAVATVLAAVALLPLLPRELMPSGSGAEVQVRYTLPGTLDAERQEVIGRRVADDVERAAAPLSPRRTIAVQEPVDLLDEPDRSSGEIVLEFASAERARQAIRRLAGGLAIPGVVIEVSPRPTALVEAAQWAGGRYEVIATAEAPGPARRLADRLRKALAAHPRLGTVSATGLREQTVLYLSPTAAAAGRAEPGELRRQVTSGLGDFVAGRVAIPGIEPPIRIRPTAAPRLELLPVRGSGVAGTEPLGALARVEARRRPEVLERQDGRWASRLMVHPPGGTAPPGLDRLVADLPLADGEVVEVGGEAWELHRSFRQLTFLLVLSLLLVFLTVTALYESMALALVVMATVPVGLAGAVCLLAAAGQTLNVMSFLGLVLLAGIVVNNSLVLLHRAEQLRTAGEPAREAVLRAAQERYRPILITTLTTLVGMIPLAALGGEGIELRRALSLAVIGGLATSTLASLLLVPGLYRAIHRRREGDTAGER